MGLSTVTYESWRAHARELAQQEQDAAAYRSERDRADDPTVNGDHEGPFGDLDEWYNSAVAATADEADYLAKQAEIYEADDRARDYLHGYDNY